MVLGLVLRRVDAEPGVDVRPGQDRCDGRELVGPDRPLTVAAQQRRGSLATGFAVRGSGYLRQMVIADILRGAAAGAAGTTALNAATYADMSVRTRPPSSTPQQVVDEVAERVGHPVLGSGEERENRLAGLGPLAGTAVGVGVGAAAGLLRPVLTRLPLPVGGALLGAAAMAATDAPLSRLDLTDPASWPGSDWLADALPHLAYGLVTFLTLRGLRPASR